MDKRGIAIWIFGLIILGLLSAYLFNQSQKNKKDLDLQASRNVLMMREALVQSAKDLKTEIKGFVIYRDALVSDTESINKAALSQGRDARKFKFGQDTTLSEGISFKDSVYITLTLPDDIAAKDSKLPKVLPGWSVESFDPEKPVYTKASYSSWLREMVSGNTFFDEVVLAQDNGNILYPEHLRGTLIQVASKTLSAQFANQNVGKFDLILKAKLHQGYASALLEGKEKLWVVGLKDQEDLVAAAYRIDYTVFTLIVLGMIFLLASTPIISFFNMDKGDILTQTRVQAIAISLLLLFAVGGWTFAYLFYKPFGSETENRLASEIKAELRSNLSEVRKLLQKEKWEKLCKLTINEVLTADKEGKMKSLFFQNVPQKSTELDFSYISIAHRNYFRNFVAEGGIKKDTVQWGFDPEKKDSLYIERIFSQKSGDPEIVLSQLREDSKSLRAISFKMDKTQLTKDRRYLLVQPSGKVVFASKQFEIPFTNLQSVLTQEKWEQFKTLVAQEAEDTLQWEIPIQINGQEYEALISPMKLGTHSGPLWYIYLVNKNSYHLKAGLVSLASMSFLILYLLIIGLVMSIPHFTTSQSNNWRRFAFRWILPEESRYDHFRRAFLVLVGLITLIFGMTYFGWGIEHLPFWSVFWVLLTIVLLTCVGVYWILQTKRHRQADKGWYYAFLFSFFLLIGFMPGFLIFKQFNTVENKLWAKSLENESLPTNRVVSGSYAHRMEFFTGMSRSNEGQVLRYFMPQPDDFEKVLAGQKIEVHLLNVSSGLWKTITLLISMLLLVGVYYGMRSLLRRLFWLDFQIEEENALSNIMDNELKGCPNLRIFLCGCDSMVNRYWVYSTFKLDQHQVFTLDCAEVGLKIPRAYELKDKKVLIVEDIHCLKDMGAFMDSIPELFGLAKNIHLVFSSGASWRSLVSKMGSDLEKVRFSELMSAFYFEFVPICPETKTGEIHPINHYSESEVEEYFRKRKIIGLESEKPYVRLLLQRYGKAYFYNIWSELSTEEKNVCYAYAVEGFINPGNYEEVVELYQKGVFTDAWTGKNLRLFSKTFRYFIISNISTATKTELINYRKKNSTANNIQWAVLSFLILAIGLVAYFERSFFTEIQAMVTGVLGFVGFLFGQAKKFFTLKGLE